MTLAPVHPDHVPAVRVLGTLCGLPVRVLVLDAADSPDQPRDALRLNGVHAWCAVGAGPWHQPYSGLARLRRWLDPVCSAWPIGDLPQLLAECRIGEWTPEEVSAAEDAWATGTTANLQRLVESITTAAAHRYAEMRAEAHDLAAELTA